ncbi:hypothetical protein [Cellulomonas sp. S1-8]|uniref:hypothetical protein n=1 Tax=Cellulomonas sp. S1-8 TaxID=2904790 RepID=UPI002243F104|nr:hypothetical protein [Cellulomonas sp. S1-8]UZN04522.1 hypothetical protein OKX07_06305 [Cellulomonas sp. S1-8]
MSLLPAVRRPSSRWLAAPLLGAVLLAGCTGGEPDDPASSAATPSTTTEAPSVEPTPSEPPPAEAAPDAPAGGPEESFLTWLAASRAPDVDTACAYMTPELAQSMVDEITSQGFPGITDCASLITMTSGLFAAAGQASEATVELREEAADRAVLHVVYVAGTSCGTVVLQPGDGHWVLSERARAEC